MVWKASAQVRVLGFVVVAGGSMEKRAVAARVLQKRVLFGEARHWAHVPGPLTQGLCSGSVATVAAVVTECGWLGLVVREASAEAI